jgi:predicted nucleotidyltransferase
LATTIDIIAKLRQSLPQIRRRSQVKSLSLFGSYVQDRQTPRSDLDILIEFSEAPSFLEFIALERYLGDLLEIKVDLVMKDALKPVIGKHVLSDAIPI